MQTNSPSPRMKRARGPSKRLEDDLGSLAVGCGALLVAVSRIVRDHKPRIGAGYCAAALNGDAVLEDRVGRYVGIIVTRRVGLRRSLVRPWPWLIREFSSFGGSSD